MGVKSLVSERIYNLSETIILTGRTGTFPDFGYTNSDIIIKDRTRGGIIHNPNPAITIASIDCIWHCEHRRVHGNLFRKGDIAELVPSKVKNLRVCFGFASQLHSQ